MRAAATVPPSASLLHLLRSGGQDVTEDWGRAGAKERRHQPTKPAPLDITHRLETPGTPDLASFHLQAIHPTPPLEPLQFPQNLQRTDFINFVGGNFNLLGFPRPLAMISDSH